MKRKKLDITKLLINEHNLPIHYPFVLASFKELGSMLYLFNFLTRFILLLYRNRRQENKVNNWLTPQDRVQPRKLYLFVLTESS